MSRRPQLPTPRPETIDLIAVPDWAVLADGAPDVLLVSTAGGAYLRVSPSAARVLGWAPHELEGRCEDDFAHPDDLALLAEHRQELVHRPAGSATTSYRFRCKDGSLRWVELSSRCSGADGRTVVLSTLRDITDRQRHNLSLQHQASTDPLTGVSNRVVLLDRLRQALRRLERTPGDVAVLGLDLDHFKIVNDSLGHAVGDDVLLMLAERLSHHLRPQDTLARLGGDEFVIVAEGLDEVGAVARLAQRIITSGREPFVVDGRSFACTVSVGVASTSDPHCDPQQLLREADLALYRAKDHGRDRAEFFDEQLRTSAESRLVTERFVRRALRDDRVRVHYQPIVDVNSRRVVAAEALVRLVDAGGGLVQPPAFLDVAEATGMLVDIDDHVMRDAVAAAAAWSDELGPIDVCLNLTARHLADTGFFSSTMDRLAAAGLAPERLEIEVTERLLMEASNSSRDALRQLREAGVKVGMDDFGTGLSSLMYLQAVPMDFLKLDPSLVAGLTSSSTARAVVAGALGVCTALGLTVTAEGVETREQMAVLAGLGCDRAQGFLFAPPLPSAELLAFLTRPGPDE